MGRASLLVQSSEFACHILRGFVFLFFGDDYYSKPLLHFTPNFISFLFIRPYFSSSLQILISSPLPRTLVHAFPDAGLGVSVATDGCVYQSEVFAASTSVIGSPISSSNGRRSKGKSEKGWGGRAVLVLVGIRLGLDGVNPVYYDTIKVRFLIF